jgi:diacylglycerol kinase family enzyme
MKRLAIINPCSGSGKTGRIQNVILDALKDIADDYVVTRYRGQCRDVARLSHDFDGLIAVGGDGTINEVVSGMDLNKQTLAIVPAGTGNSLARDIGIRTLSESVLFACKAMPAPIDIVKVSVTTSSGKIDEWYCVCMASVGFPARLTRLANNFLKKTGPLCYPLASMACAVSQKRIGLHAFYDYGTPCRMQLTGIIIQNTRHAANFEVFPEAILNDGLFDVMELDAGFIKQTLHNLSILSGMHVYRPAVTRRVSSLKISAEKPQIFMIDGEILFDIKEIEISIASGKLKCHSKI